MRTESVRAFERHAWSADQAAEALKAHGCRVTRPRTAVLRALLEHDGPIDVPALTRMAEFHEPGIHEATVYRTVATLAEVGIVTHVHAGHGPALVRLHGDVALVAVCQDCGSIEPVPASVVDALVTGTQVTTGFVLEPGHFALEGICAACAA
ncbi:MAG: transcriptional repressor [Actinomycetota bacterium]